MVTHHSLGVIAVEPETSHVSTLGRACSQTLEFGVSALAKSALSPPGSLESGVLD